MILVMIKLIASIFFAVWIIGVSVFACEFFKIKGNRSFAEKSPAEQRDAYAFIIAWPVFVALILWRRYRGIKAGSDTFEKYLGDID